MAEIQLPVTGEYNRIHIAGGVIGGMRLCSRHVRKYTIDGEKQKEKTKGGIILADDTVERSQVASTCGLVLDMGPHCYDKERFPEGPWAKKGDWIIFARYAGSRIKIDGGEIRLLNDDEILATVENPEDIFHEF